MTSKMQPPAIHVWDSAASTMFYRDVSEIVSENKV